MENNIIQKIKEWLKKSKPQFEIVSSVGDKIESVRRLKDGVVFRAHETIGHVRIAGFLNDLVHVYLFVTKVDVYDTNIPTPQVRFAAVAEDGDKKELDNIHSVTLTVKNVEINQIEILEDINKIGWKECLIKE